MIKKTNSKKTETPKTSAKPINDAKIAVVDVQFLVSQTPSVMALRQEQQSKIANLQQWINAANAQIAGEPNQQNKVGLTQKYQLELNQRQQILNQEYRQKVMQIDAELSKLISDVATKNGYEYVFAKGIVVYGGTDITASVAEKLKK